MFKSIFGDTLKKVGSRGSVAARGGGKGAVDKAISNWQEVIGEQPIFHFWAADDLLRRVYARSCTCV
jgi:hypothetical protein